MNIRVLNTIKGPLNSANNCLEKQKNNFDGPMNVLQGLEENNQTKKFESDLNEAQIWY